MLKISTLEDIIALRETFELECKLAAGKDGKGAVPKSFWDTYSAFANSYGGYIVLGLKENKGKFTINSVQEPQRVIDDLWSLINNSQKVSANILREKDVQEINVNGETLICIHVPRASRTAKPVFINGNPLKGTYKRQNTGDFLCNEETVRRMLAEQVEGSRDNEIIQHYGIEDLDLTSLNAYRNLFAAQSPDHPWIKLEPQVFLRNIGGWRLDRESGQGGLTRAGLLMFGQLASIHEIFPNYMLDYQERPAAKTEARWIDRVTLDGSWSGNLFDFYQKIIKKLTSDLKVPFELHGGKRQDDTPAHQALREALVNTIVHADFSGRASLLVVKRPDMFGFRNPGLMRVPLEIAVKGGESDCRNRTIHKMFRLIGLGEQAGSGIPKIYQSWSNQHWRTPSLLEKETPSEQTLLELRMLSLVPEEALEYLRETFGNKFDSLDEEKRLILITAYVERTINHSRMMEIMDMHSHDLTKHFSHLTEMGILRQEGIGRGTIYFLPETGIQDEMEEIFGFSRKSSGGLLDSSGGLDLKSGGLKHSNDEWNALLAIAEPVRNKRKAAKPLVEMVILDLCNGRHLSLQQLEELLNRSGDFLRKDYLKPMIRSKQLQLLYPTKPNHPEQAYTAIAESL
ncbi:MAG: putative DNA binding domain-containing protein [Gammaproteobacteria bacterium]|nr:putative DNA binding domain-containing protein [Gammaproteobacteria bacterium]